MYFTQMGPIVVVLFESVLKHHRKEATILGGSLFIRTLQAEFVVTSHYITKCHKKPPCVRPTLARWDDIRSRQDAPWPESMCFGARGLPFGRFVFT